MIKTNNRKEAQKKYKKKELNVRREFYWKVGTQCLFCKRKEPLVCHKINFEKHTRIARLTIAQVKKEKVKDYARLCFLCHYGVHWAHNSLGLSWKQIVNRAKKISHNHTIIQKELVAKW